MRSGTYRFNRICQIIAVGWLLIAPPAREIHHPSSDDFDQYYDAAVAVTAGRWDLVYSVPTKNSPRNPGLEADSQVKPELQRMLAARGVTHVFTHFIQLPPAALLIAPLGWLGRREAHFVWIVALSISAAVVTLQAGRIAEICYGRATRASGVVALLIAFSHLFYRSIRVSNVSVMMGALVGWAVLDLYRRHDVRSGAALALSSIMKYFGAALVPLAIAVGRWRAIGWSILWTALLFGVTLQLAGRAVFVEFFTSIAPRLNRSEYSTGNHSVEGFVVRLTNTLPLERTDRIIIQTFSAIVLAAVLLAIFARRKSLLTDPPAFFAAAASLLCWMMLFAPICWTHYLINLAPLWGWLAWEFRQGWFRRFAAGAAIAMSLILSTSFPGVKLPEPIQSHPLFAMILILGLGIARLLDTSSGGRAAPAHTEETAPLAST